MSIVRVEKLVRYYGRLCALDNVSFSMKKGEIIGVLGLNGAGKTTCLRILAGLLTPTAGKAEVGGMNILDNPVEIRAQVGFLPEEPPLYRDMTVDSFLRHTGKLKGMSDSDVNSRIPEVCERTGLDEITRYRIISELSHGYRKRVGIAQAILHKPPLVILDEPISGLDPAQIVEMRKTVRSLKNEHSVMVSSHILTEISQTCDRILVFHNGKLVAEGSEEDLAGQAGGRIEIILRGKREKLEKILSDKPDIRDFSVHAQPEAGIHLLSFATHRVSVGISADDDKKKTKDNDSKDPEIIVESLVSELVKEGFSIRRVSEAGGELETVFLGLTENKKEEAVQ